MGTSDTDRRSIRTASPFLASHHGVMDVRNDGVDVRSIVLKLGNDNVGVCDTLMNVRNGHTHADCKFGLEAGS